MTFVKTKLLLERMKAGETVEIRLTGEEPLGGGADAGDVGDAVLADAFAAAGVGQEAFFLGDGLDGEGGAVAGGEGVAGAEDDALQDGGAAGVDAALAGGGKVDGDAVGIELRDHAEPEFGLAFTEAALADGTERHGGIRGIADAMTNAICGMIPPKLSTSCTESQWVM